MGYQAWKDMEEPYYYQVREASLKGCKLYISNYITF